MERPWKMIRPCKRKKEKDSDREKNRITVRKKIRERMSQRKMES